MTPCAFVIAVFVTVVAWPAAFAATLERLLMWRDRRLALRDFAARVTYLPSAACRPLGETAGHCDFDTCAICKTKTPPSDRLASGVSEANAGGGRPLPDITPPPVS